MKLVRLALSFACVVVLSACDPKGKAPDPAPSSATSASTAAFVLTSPALTEGARVPAPFACADYDHLGKSPPLSWSAPPEGTVEIAITVVDPDAQDFKHWGLINLPADTRSLPEGASPGGALPASAHDLQNDFEKVGYGGPCPPPGTPHRYVFTVYALKRPVTRTKLDDGLLRTLAESAIATSKITAVYSR
jgi:hypothetical protein